MTRFAVTHPINRLAAEMDRLFDGLWGPQAQRWVAEGPVSNFPPLNVWEDAEAYHVEAELAGLPLEDIELFVKDREISIKGHRRSPGGKDSVFHRNERFSGEFVRELRLPLPIDSDKVEAKLSDGVLTLDLPKAESAKGRKIAVKAG